MNDQQIIEMDACPVSAKGILERAYAGNSRATAIKAMCLQCVGYIRAEITNCSAYGCPLRPYRPYQNGVEDDAEDV